VISTVGAVQMQGAAATLTNHYHLQIGTTTLNGWAITNAYGINVVNQGAAGVVNAYGLYIANQTGASTNNIGLRNLGTSLFDGVATFTLAPVLPNAAIANAKLASDTARANLLTNGGFEIWQRGNGPFTATGAWLADRWVLTLVGTDTLSVSRDAVNQDAGSQVCAACVFTLGTGAGGSYVGQTLKTGDHSLVGTTLSASVRVRTATANACRLGVYNGATWTYSAFHSGGGTYQTLTATAAGITGHAWVVVYFAASCTAYLDNAVLVVGSQAADYAPLHPADDLARCLRYFEVISSSVGDINVTGYGAAGISCQTPFAYKARKAVNPTVTKNGTWALLNCGQPSAGAAGVDIVSIGVTVTALGTYSFNNNGAGQNFTLEANP
jgi:hypothetical protein